jgi:poly(A) polymerase
MVFKGIRSRVRSLLSRQSTTDLGFHRPTIVTRDHHPVSRKMISSNALKVLYRLESAGFQAFLVGGCIRDILLGVKPKDFDIATNAHPEQIHKLFRNSRLIGRRFRLVHVHFGREIIEVATFRASHDSEESKGKSATSDHGMLLRDNVYGTVEDDASRRDFTANALYYTVSDFSIHDYGTGLKDIEARTLRMIGTPAVRYQEDPVRMLRAIRFAAKLNFEIEEETKAPIKDMAVLLANIPSARLFDEVLKLFQSGHAEQSFLLLREYGLFKFLFPETDELLDDTSNPENAKFIENLILATCRNTDKRIKADRPVTPIFLFAAFLWPKVMQHWAYQKENMPPVPALSKAANLTLDVQVKSTAIPRRFSTAIKEVWDLQIRLEKRNGRKAYQAMEHPRFRAAYDFILLREQAGENLNGLGDWWTQFQSSDDNAKKDMADKTPGTKKPKRRYYKSNSNKAKNGNKPGGNRRNSGNNRSNSNRSSNQRGNSQD